mmetsp:Transcript_83869/g.218463  ORF Transcript_83869/g.218463 Transcript_83869/m.218463 type:complete len:246 (+) Transcript_83869:650-1387(+)
MATLVRPITEVLAQGVAHAEVVASIPIRCVSLDRSFHGVRSVQVADDGGSRRRRRNRWPGRCRRGRGFRNGADSAGTHHRQVSCDAVQAFLAVVSIRWRQCRVAALTQLGEGPQGRIIKHIDQDGSRNHHRSRRRHRRQCRHRWQCRRQRRGNKRRRRRGRQRRWEGGRLRCSDHRLRADFGCDATRRKDPRGLVLAISRAADHLEVVLARVQCAAHGRFHKCGVRILQKTFAVREVGEVSARHI